MSETARTKRRWMPVLLVISLAVNLLVAGVVLGTVLRFKGGDHARIPPGFGAALYHAMPKDDRKALRGELSGLRTKGASGRVQNFSELLEALQAVPFDPETVEALLQQQTETTLNLQGAMQQKWLTYVTELTDGERQIYAERLEEVVQRGPHGKRKNKND